MKIVVFGDVHGNLIALEKLFQLEQTETDFFVCHGDVVNYGPWTNECISYLKDISNCILLKGNHEHYFLKGVYDGENVIAQTFFKHCFANFDATLTTEIEKYETEVIIKNFTIKHTLNDKYIFENTNIQDLKLDQNYIIGHSHQQFYRRENDFELYNTGSIGQNRKHINQSCYLKYDTETNIVELKQYLHDIDKVIDQMKSEKYPQLCIDYYSSKQRL